MNAYRLVLLFVLFTSQFCKAQSYVKISTPDQMSRTVNPVDTLDFAVIRCEYTQLIVTDTLRPTRWVKNRMLLQIGNNISKFFNYDRFVSDSISREQTLSGVSFEEIMNSDHNRKRGSVGYEIYKRYPSNKKITYVDDIFAISYLYEENIISPKWELLPDTMTILGYLCKKASCTFYCREYVAWYAPEIAVSEGPWKFTGLPGLILQVRDKNRQVRFEAVAIEKVKWRDPIGFEIQGRQQRTTKEKFHKAYINYMKNPSSVIQQYVQFDEPVALNSKPYNLIELCE